MLFIKVVESVKAYNEKHGKELATVHQKKINGRIEMYACVVDAFASRAHKLLPQAGDIIAVDATSSLDLQDTKLIRFVTCSPAGGIPLGYILSSHENEETLVEAFGELQKILPVHAFKNRGPELGPVCFLTDDCDGERNALHPVWPTSILLLCQWHELSAVWRWECDEDHGIHKSDRQHLYWKFKALVYAQTAESFKDCKEEFDHDAVVAKYPNFKKYVETSYMGRVSVWATYVRLQKKLPTHGMNTAAYSENSFGITKDDLSEREKCFNFPDM